MVSITLPLATPTQHITRRPRYCYCPFTLGEKNGRKARMEIPGAKRHPSKDAEVPFGGLPIHVDVSPEGTAARGPTAPGANVWLGNLEGEAGRSATGAQIMVAMLNGRRQIRMRAQQRGEPRRNGPRRRCRFPGERPKVSLGGTMPRPRRVMRLLPSSEKSGEAGDAQSRA